jgi:PAS domain S-box-containing protein
MVEDIPEEAELIELYLRRHDYAVEVRRVDCPDAMQDALAAQPWDVILADYRVPGFGALAALAMLKVSRRDIPFIIVSGTISDENAVAAMRAGAHDYVLKSNLSRLFPAIEREIQEAAARAEKRQIEVALQQSDADLRERETRLEGIISSAMDAIISVDENRRIILFNRAAEKMFLCDAAKALGSSLDQFIPVSLREAHGQHFLRFASEGHTSRSMTSPAMLNALRANGEEFPIEATISQVEAAGQKLYTVILRDITERKSLEHQLQQARKLEAIGRLAGGVAHDFNTLLNVMLGHAELLDHELAADDPRRERVHQIETAAQMSAGLTKQLLTFSRKQPIVPRVIDLCEAVVRLEPMLRRVVREDIELDLQLPSKPCPVKVDPGQMHQVLLNLAANARDAMPCAGVLTISVGPVELDNLHPLRAPELPRGRYISLAVTDTGTGMDAATAASIFEPFFTTKAPGTGTGLGLATVYGIVKQSGGEISVQSELGSGSTFRILLPASDEKIAALEEEPHVVLPVASRGNETILLAEDSTPLRELTRELLAREGYNLLVASDGTEALDVCTAAARVDLLLTDIVMPGLRGPELVEKIRQRRPEMRVVYLSGYAEESLRIDGALVLEKPYNAERLYRTVRHALDGTHGG